MPDEACFLSTADFPEPLGVRPACPADEPFLATLHRSTRSDLLALAEAGVDVEPLIAMQWRAQCAGYRERFPDAVSWILEPAGEAVGRLLVARDDGGLHLVDFAILPGARRRGHARRALRGLQGLASRMGQPVRLHVRRDNAPALALYQACGFRVEAGDPVSVAMVWHPQPAPRGQPE